MTPETETVPASLYRALRDERDELAERLRQIEGQDAGSDYEDAMWAFMRRYGVTKCQAHVLWHLMRAHTAVKFQPLNDWPTEGDPDHKIIDVQIAKIRKKLAPHGLKIMTQWGLGYYVDEAMKAELRRVAEGRDAA